MKIKKSVLIIIILLLFATLFVNRAMNWATDHYEYYTIGEISEVRERHIDALKCFSCHAYTQKDGFFVQKTEGIYSSPYNLAVTPDDDFLLVTGQESDRLYIIDLNNNQIVNSIQVGERPHTVIISPDGKKAYVTNQWSGTVSVINLDSGEEINAITVGGGASGIVADFDRNILYVANTYTANISVVDLNTETEIKRLRAGNYPSGLNISPDNSTVVAVSQRSVIVEHRDPPKTEVTIIDAATQRVSKRNYFMESHIMEKVMFTPSGDLAFTTLVRPKNLVPAVQVENGWMMTFALGIFFPETGAMVQLPLDDPNLYYADPYDVRITPDGKRAFISHSGNDYITAVDVDMIRNVLERVNSGEIVNPENDLLLSESYVLNRIATGSNPKGMAISADGNTLYVAERLTDHIALIDTQTLEIRDYIALNDANQNAFLRRGEQLFNNAAHTFQYQYSCYSCHPDNHEDGLTYDMAYYPGMDISNVQTLRELSNTSPFKWNGKNVSIYMQCGMRFSRFITRTEIFAPDDLKALVGYITSKIEHPPNIYRGKDDDLTEAQKRGKELFERTTTNSGEAIPLRDQCITCHPPPNFTDRKMHDVGTATDKDTHPEFLTPNMNNIYESPPYLHDGRAQTLEELWTIYNDDDLHGVANDMTKDQLNDLVEYLRSLGRAEYYYDK